MILITGATGAVGGMTARFLSEHNESMRLLVRDPARAPELPGPEVAVGDYADPKSLDRACRGVQTVFLVSGHAPEGERAKLHRNVIEAASRAGAAHIVYLSFQSASPNSKFPMGRDHNITEGYLRKSGVPFTALRNNLYMDIVPYMFDPKGVLRGPAGEGRTSWISRRDIAQVAAEILKSPPRESGSLVLAGPESLTMEETAERFSRLTGRQLRYENESIEEGREWRRGLGVAEWEVEMMVGSYLAVAAGELADTSDAVRQVLGRDPYTLDAYFAEYPDLLAPLHAGGAS